MALDPETHAVRDDLADVRLAEHVFAPHYAAPVPHVLTVAATLHRRRGADPMTDLAAGEAFEVLDLIGKDAWGISPARGLVGYLDRTALDVAA